MFPSKPLALALGLAWLSAPAFGKDLDTVIPDLLGQIPAGFAPVVTIIGGSNPGTFVAAGGTGAFNGTFDPSDALGVLGSQVSSQLQRTPVGSTVAAFTFEFDSQLNVFTRSTEGLGPQLSERAETTGRGKLNVSFSYTHARFDIFEHQDIHKLPVSFSGTTPISVLGGSSEFAGNGSALAIATGGAPLNFGGSNTLSFTDSGGGGMDDGSGGSLFTGVHTTGFTNGFFTVPDPKTQLDLDVRVEALGLFANYGVTDRIDVGLVLPLMWVDVVGEVTASGLVDPGTGLPSAPATDSADGRDFGVGDLILRGKLFIADTKYASMAARLDIVLPTGDEHNFRGYGDPAYAADMIVSKDFGRFAFHGNAGVFIRSHTAHEDVARYSLGADVVLHPRVSATVDFIGAAKLNGNGIGDRIDSLATGFKINPTGRLVIGLNGLWRLNSQGLRSDFIPTVTIEHTFAPAR